MLGCAQLTSLAMARTLDHVLNLERARYYAVRTVYMALLPYVDATNVDHLVLNTLPSFIFFSAYFVFLFFWCAARSQRWHCLLNIALGRSS